MTCKLCNGTKLIPFIKNGKLIPHAFLDCECKVDEPEHYREIRPEDFDFPCSSFFREYVESQYALPSEQRTKVLYLDYETPPAPAPQPWDKRQQYQIDQVRGELNNIKMKLAEVTRQKAKTFQQPKKSEYKGLVIE